MDVPLPPITVGGATVTVVPVFCLIRFWVLFTRCTCCCCCCDGPPTPPVCISCAGPAAERAKILAPVTVIALGYAVKRQKRGERTKESVSKSVSPFTLCPKKYSLANCDCPTAVPWLLLLLPLPLLLGPPIIVEQLLMTSTAVEAPSGVPPPVTVAVVQLLLLLLLLLLLALLLLQTCTLVTFRTPGFTW